MVDAIVGCDCRKGYTYIGRMLSTTLASRYMTDYVVVRTAILAAEGLSYMDYGAVARRIYSQSKKTCSIAFVNDPIVDHYLMGEMRCLSANIQTSCYSQSHCTANNIDSYVDGEPDPLHPSVLTHIEMCWGKKCRKHYIKLVKSKKFDHSSDALEEARTRSFPDRLKISAQSVASLRFNSP